MISPAKKLLLLWLLLATGTPLAALWGQGSAFTYQGQLQVNGTVANGLYDFQFQLTADALGDNDVGSPFTTNAIAVSGGLFTTTVNFGSGVFTGSNYWLVVSVRTNNPANTLSYTSLYPPQQVTVTPYAILATTAINLSGAVSAAQLTGTVSVAQLPSVVPTSVTLNTSGGISGSSAIAANNYNLTIGQTNLWPATNAMGGGGIVNCSYPVTTCFTNASFTFGQPVNVQASGYNQTVIEVANTSGSVITITPGPGWHSLPNSVWNCTNETMVTLFIRPGQVTNVASTPVF
jgi:hypothetical protein